MNLQQFFYIAGSVAAVMFIIFAIFAVTAIIKIQRKVNRIHRIIKATAWEIGGLVNSAKSYSKYLGASFGLGFISRIIRMVRRYNS